jgi:hypothetical protein
MFGWLASNPAGVSFSIVVISGLAVTATVMVWTLLVDWVLELEPPPQAARAIALVAATAAINTPLPCWRLMLTKLT